MLILRLFINYLIEVKKFLKCFRNLLNRLHSMDTSIYFNVYLVRILSIMYFFIPDLTI